MFNCECGADLIQEDCETILDVCQEAPVVKDYETLANKPQINGVTLDGNKTSEDLGITQEIADAVSAEATLRENADTALGGRIDDEITNRGNADTALGGRIDGEITNRTNADNALGTRIDNEILARQGGDNNLQTQIDAITSKSDVVDVVADYEALQAYDTQHLGNNDVIKVLDDETHDDAQTYYRWNKTAGTWSYIGSEAPYYSKGQMDTMLQAKQDKLIAGTNIQIAQDGKTISATDTTYTAGNGLNLNGTEFSADTTVLATKADLDSYYTKTETDNKLAPKLETEVVSTLPATGDEGKLYLTPKNYTTGTTSGNPITINLGEDAGQITSAQLDGDTFQQSYTGQNLYNFAEVSTGTYVTKDDDGWITITRNNTSGSSTVYTNAWTSNLALETSTQYKIFIEVKAVSGTGSLFITSTNSTQGQFSSWEEKRLANMEAGRTYTVTPTTKPSFSGISQGLRTVLEQTAGQGGSVTFRISVCASSTPTDTFSYEPYTGGVPSPNPSYPQQIQTVTGEQTVTITGKNLFDKNEPLSDYYINANGVMVYGVPKSYINQEYPAIPSSTFAFSYSSRTDGAYIRFAEFDTNGVFTKRTLVQNNNATITLRGDTAKVLWSVDAVANLEHFNDLQIEIRNSASTYAPYSKQTLPIDLGSIELCKLGTYQDYIYKDGNSWKVHKAIATITVDGSESWSYNGDNKFSANNISGMAMPINADALCYCATHIGVLSAPNGAAFTSLVADIPYATDVHKTLKMVRIKDIRFTTTTELESWLSQNNTTIYYVVATATDTVITDTALIAQLEAVRTASLQASNTITNTATGTNLAGDLELGYYEYDPTNRYDKWLWLDLNNAYEKLGG